MREKEREREDGCHDAETDLHPADSTSVSHEDWEGRATATMVSVVLDLVNDLTDT